jgi:hypothetical protein
MVRIAPESLRESCRPVGAEPQARMPEIGARLEADPTNIAAALALARAHERGEGVPRDAARAMAFYGRAALPSTLPARPARASGRCSSWRAARTPPSRPPISTVSCPS